MRFLIVGAGALGGYYGGMLLKGGADVTFLVRPRRAAQLAERGLTIKEADNTFTTSVRTVQAGALGGPYDVVFLACKAYDLDGAITDFAPALVADGAVLPVLNGINHLAVLTDRLGAGRVLGGVAWFSAVLTADGEIAIPGAGTTGRISFGELTGERSPRCERIDAALRAGGIPSTVLDDVIAEMWAKFCGLASAAAISTLTRGKTGEVAAAPAGAGFVDATLDECARVTTAEGYPPPAAVLDMYRRAYSRIGTAIAPSILLDVENGRPTEGEHIIDDLVRRVDRLGVQVPILRAALCNLQVYEARHSARV